jgi:hypothetical protein
VATPTGNGHFMVASDGGIFAFGGAMCTGSLGGSPPGNAIVSVLPTYSGYGYTLLESNGAVHPFGDATLSVTPISNSNDYRAIIH